MPSKEPFLFLHEKIFHGLLITFLNQVKFVIPRRALLFRAAILIFCVYVGDVPTAASSCAWNSSLNKNHTARRLDMIKKEIYHLVNQEG